MANLGHIPHLDGHYHNLPGITQTSTRRESSRQHSTRLSNQIPQGDGEHNKTSEFHNHKSIITLGCKRSLLVKNTMENAITMTESSVGPCLVVVEERPKT